VNPNIVLVLNNGRPLSALGCRKYSAIVEGWQLGTQSCNAIAQVLYGDYNQAENYQCHLEMLDNVQFITTHSVMGRPVNKEENVFYITVTSKKNHISIWLV
jgi:beta-glucosidase